MITRKELLESKEFWLVKLQASLYQQVENYLKEHKMSKTQFAEKLGVTKGYVSQILNGDFDHKLSKLIELSLAIEKAPLFKFENLTTCHAFDAIGELEVIEKSSFRLSTSIQYTKDYNIPISVLQTKRHRVQKNITHTIDQNPSMAISLIDNVNTYANETVFA